MVYRLLNGKNIRLPSFIVCILFWSLLSNGLRRMADGGNGENNRKCHKTANESIYAPHKQKSYFIFQFGAGVAEKQIGFNMIYPLPFTYFQFSNRNNKESKSTCHDCIFHSAPFAKTGIFRSKRKEKKKTSGHIFVLLLLLEFG